MKLRSSSRGGREPSPDIKQIVLRFRESGASANHTCLGAVTDFSQSKSKYDQASTRHEASKRPCGGNAETEWISTKPIYVANGRAPAKGFPPSIHYIIHCCISIDISFFGHLRHYREAKTVLLHMRRGWGAGRRGNTEGVQHFQLPHKVPPQLRPTAHWWGICIQLHGAQQRVSLPAPSLRLVLC